MRMSVQGVDLVPLAIILMIVTVDLLLRLWIFGRLESVALDIVVFSLTYCIVEFARYAGAPDNGPGGDAETIHELKVWGTKAGSQFVILCILAVYHGWANRTLENQVNSVLTDKLTEMGEHDRPTFRAAMPILMRSVVVTFVGPDIPFIRKGKKTWRNEVQTFVERVATNTSTLTAGDLLISRASRIYGLLLFGIGSVSSMLVVVWPT